GGRPREDTRAASDDRRYHAGSERRPRLRARSPDRPRPAELVPPAPRRAVSERDPRAVLARLRLHRDRPDDAPRLPDRVPDRAARVVEGRLEPRDRRLELPRRTLRTAPLARRDRARAARLDRAAGLRPADFR